jgi:hypothetical protein
VDVLDDQYTSKWLSYASHCAINTGLAKASVDDIVKRVHANYPSIVYPPLIFSKAYMDHIALTAKQLVRIVESIPQRIFAGDFRQWMEFLGVESSTAHSLLPMGTPRAMQLATTFARPDILATKSGFKVVEINVSPYIGVGICGRIAAVSQGSPYFEYMRSLGVTPTAPDMASLWRKTIQSITRASSGRSRPKLFLAGAKLNDDFTEDFGLPDFEDLMRSCGYEFLKGPMKELTVKPSGVFFEGTKVDAVFAGLTYQEMVRDSVPDRLIRALTEADERRVIDFICPPINSLFENKLTLELLSSDKFSSYFSQDELAVLRECIPRTERISEHNLPMAMKNKDKYVLKPTTEYGGEGVTIGLTTPDSEWRGKLSKAKLNPNGFLLQDVVDDGWTYEVGDGPDMTSFAVCLGPMIFGHEYAGTLLRQIRHSGSPKVINAATGAEVGVAFVAQG